MFRIFQYMKGYIGSVILIVILLLAQAFCDLSLPAYTSDIIDTGIQNKGVEHILPEKITKEEFSYGSLFMNEKEEKQWKEAYDQKGEIYSRKDFSEKKLDEIDEALAIPLIATHQMSSVEESMVMAQLEKQNQMKSGTMTREALKQMFQQANIPFHETKKVKNKKTTYYMDERPFLKAMVENNAIQPQDLQKIRKQMEEKFDTMGESLVHSTAVTYTTTQEKLAGVDVDQKQTSYLWLAGSKMLLIALLMAIVTVMVALLASRVGAGVGRDLRGKIYEKVMSFSSREMNQFSTASLITRSTNDIQQIQMVETMLLRMIIYAPILGIGGIIKVVQTGSGMGWIIVLAVVWLLVVVMALLKLAMPKFKKMQVLVDRVNLVSREILTGLSVIRAFGREEKEEERFEDANKALTKNMLFTNRVMTFMMPCMMVIMNGVSVLIVWVSAGKIDSGTIEVGTMTAFITYAMQIVMSFLMLTAMSVMMPRAAVAAERIDQVLEIEPAIVDGEDKEGEITSGVVSFENVDFAYPGGEENVLENISFTAKPGQVTAIIGGTGSGKSTLINLIPRFYDTTSGKITIDGVDVRQMTQKNLRKEIGYVPQKGVLFSGTIASNLKYGKEDATREEMEEAIRIAQATEIVENKKNGYDSAIAQGGSNVSGGQKQRFSIARAIVKNPKIYIFDDSFSALDYKTDAMLRRELQKKTKDATVFIVAQRISTILHAEQIIVLDEGKVAGIGNHAQLMKDCQVYREIAKSQLSEKELQEVDNQGKEENSYE